jgi:hypothetical protein
LSRTGWNAEAGSPPLEWWVVHAAGIDQLEVGKRVSGQIRFAFEVEDVHVALERALEYGATLVHEPTLTPWKDLNARVRSPEGLQITLFQVMGGD